MKHVMVDLESMAGAPDGAVISVGLAEFDPALGEVVATHEVRCTLEAQREIGRRFDPGTVEWWLRQSPEAQKQLLAEPRHKSAVKMMQDVDGWLRARGAKRNWDLALWAKGPSFDLVLLRSLADDVEQKWYPHYSREYCVRTMLMVAKANGWTDILEMEPEVAHGALSDAVHQAKQVMEVMKRLKR